MKPNIVAYTAVFLLSFVNNATGNPTFQYQLKERGKSKSSASVSALGEQKRTVFIVTDCFGIGSATITLASGRWPKHIALRFRYEKGRGFRCLEGFNIMTSRLHARGGMQDSGRMSFYFPNAEGKYDVGDSPAGTLNILFEERNNALEVTLPSNILVGAKEVKIGWIDAYR